MLSSGLLTTGRSVSTDSTADSDSTTSDSETGKTASEAQGELTELLWHLVVSAFKLSTHLTPQS